MCCRFLFGLEEENDIYEPIEKMKILFNKNYPFLTFPKGDIFPSDTVCVYAQRGGKIFLENMVWGLKNPKNNKLIINAKSETITEKVMFKNILNNRCVILCNGFYEWSEDNLHQKYIFKREKEPTYLCAIYKDNRFVILTKEANESMKGIHHRMPVIVDTKDVKQYLFNNEFFFLSLKNEGPFLCRQISL